MTFVEILTNMVPASTKEWVLTVLVFVLLACILLWNKALMKCKDINLAYVEEKRLYDKFLASNDLEFDFEKFASFAGVFDTEDLKNV